MALRYGIIFWVLMTAIYYLLEMADCGMSYPQVNPWVIAILALPSLGMAILGLRRMLRMRDKFEDQFYTLTEGGLLAESEKHGTYIFIPWRHITMVRRSGSTINMFTKNGRAFPCVLEGISEPRQREFFAFAMEHAGKGSVAQLTPPPPAAMVGEPLRYSATFAQKKELADAIALVDGGSRIQYFRPLMLLVWGLLLILACYEGDTIFEIVSCLMFACSAYSLWRPGHRFVGGKESNGADVYVDGDSYLVVKDDGMWSYVRQTEVKGACRLQYCDFYSFSAGTYLGIDRDQPRPPQWPEPCGKLPRRLTGWPLLLVVLVVLLLAGYAAVIRCPVGPS